VGLFPQPHFVSFSAPCPETPRRRRGPRPSAWRCQTAALFVDPHLNVLAVAAHEAARGGNRRASFAASRPALSIANRRRSRAGTMALTSPNPSASSASKASPSNKYSVAFAMPIRRGKSSEDAASGTRPNPRMAGEISSRRGVDEIAMQHHGRANTDRKAIDRRDERCLACRERLDESKSGNSPAPARFEKISDIIARREHAARPANRMAPIVVSCPACRKASVAATYMAPVSAFFLSGRSKSRTEPHRRARS